MVKPGQIIGLILGMAFVLFPIVGFMTGEASFNDSQGKMVGFGFIIFGAFMIIVNIIGLIKGTDDLLASSSETTNSKSASKSKSEDEEENASEAKVRCRFCKKLYSSEYNGCPYCKKK